MWLQVMAFAVVFLAFAIAAALVYGTKRWQSETRAMCARLEETRVPIASMAYDPLELDGLPTPVQRYFRAVLHEGQPLVGAVTVEHAGTFNMGQTEEQWKPFKSTQRFTTQRPGFVWDARIHMAPAMTAHVHDAYIAGEGFLTAKLFGLLTVAEQPSTPELEQGELMRYLAESAWFPTALLPGQGVVWEAIDETQARATLTDGTTTVELVFGFNAEGLLSSVRSDRRYRDVDGVQVATPWQGSFWDYEVRDGMFIPLEGEVAWLLPGGPKPYWRGRIERVKYDYS